MKTSSALARPRTASDLVLDRREHPSLVGQLGRRLLLARLTALSAGQIRIRDAGQVYTFGATTADYPHCVDVEVLDGRFWGDVAFGGTVGAGEAYIRGYWCASDLTTLVRLMVRNRDVMESLEGGPALVSAPLRRLLHFLNRSTQRGAERNIAAHYDLGNDFFELFLDPTMAYSCAIYPREDATLVEASIAKFDVICTKLGLGPSDHLLEIGTGWGGLAIHAARHYGCRVTTTTLSREQYDYACASVERAGLAERITLLRQDYRDLRGEYDKLVSIEMIEAVGAPFLDTYFATCSRLLKPDGVMLLQAITLQDQFYAAALKAVDYIQRHVFPGSFLPSIAALAESVMRATDMKIFHLEDFGPHYARTLRDWRLRLHDNLGAVRNLGFTDEFLRLWEYYLCYCEGGFAERQLGDVHMLLTKPRCRIGPMISGLPAAEARA